jgi:hypothetical protein
MDVGLTVPGKAQSYADCHLAIAAASRTLGHYAAILRRDADSGCYTDNVVLYLRVKADKALRVRAELEGLLK